MEARMSFIGLFILLLMGIGGAVFFALIIAMLRDKKTRTIGIVLLIVPLLGGVFLALVLGFVGVKSGRTVHEEELRAEAQAYQAEAEAYDAEMRMHSREYPSSPLSSSVDTPLIPLDQTEEDESPIDVDALTERMDELSEEELQQLRDELDRRAEASSEDETASDTSETPTEDIEDGEGPGMGDVQPNSDEETNTGSDTEPSGDASDTFTPVSITPNTPSLEALTPSWLESPPYAEGDVYYWPIKIEPCPTKESCEERLNTEIERVIYLYVSDKQGMGDEIADQARLSPDFIRSRMIDPNDHWFVPVETSFGTWYELYTRVEFDQEADLEIERMIATHRRADRLTMAGILAAFVLFFLGIVYSYGMVSQSTDGQYKWRLRTALGLGILLLGFAGAFALSIIA
jgi:hypothetical protein